MVLRESIERGTICSACVTRGKGRSPPTVQIENHLANLPAVRSVNKFRFTRGSSPVERKRASIPQRYGSAITQLGFLAGCTSIE